MPRPFRDSIPKTAAPKRFQLFGQWLARLVVLAALLPLASTAAQEPTDEGLQFFETKIRPVLVEHCYECHSSQAAAEGKLRGGLALDTREATRIGGDSGPAVVPGETDRGELLPALRHESYEMPPSGKLSDEVIADFEKWIALGAPDPRDGGPVEPKATIDIAAGRNHWAFRPLEPQPLPAADLVARGWPDSPIDRWLDQAQRQRGVTAVPPASARTLIRRVWFDLLGLPPTPEEMEAWVARLAIDGEESGRVDSEAYGELVDRLLADPAFGERQARHWMDLARFAESHGYEQDYDRPHAYHYRDFLIRAFNDDLPYDTFVRWQLAGDELAPDEPPALMATGFLGAGAFPTQLTEAEFESARYDELDDMVGTMGVAMLGLSIGCARCHDHKYDPIPASDYYALAANFASTIRTEIDLDLDPEGNERRRRDYATREAELLAERERIERDEVPLALRQWLDDGVSFANDGEWQTLSGSISSSAGTEYRPLEDGSLLASGTAPPTDRLSFATELPAGTTVAALRLEALADPSLPNGGPGRAGNGNFALGNLSVRRFDEAGTAQEIALTAPRATHQQNETSLSIAASLDDDGVSGWAVDGQIGRDQAAVVTIEPPLTCETATRLEIELRFDHPNPSHIIGRPRFSIALLADAPVEVGSGGPSVAVSAALARYRETRSEDVETWPTLLAWFRTRVPAWQQADAALTAHRAAGPGPQLTRAMIASEGLPHLPHHADDRGFPHFYPETFVLRRGDVHQKIAPAEPGFLSVLTDPTCDRSTWQRDRPDGARTSLRRAALADWIVDVDRGAGALLARVMANRLWQHHFGRGLVATPSDFGFVGAPPDHPELLEMLAAELIAGGWRLKQLHRRIVTSAAYVRSSVDSEAGRAADPDNVTWWRREPRRLEAEAIRDTMLATAGRLDRTMYGPGSLDPDMTRRSVYFFIKRSELIPMMMLFDWPEHLVSIGQRARTTIAPQALMFLNSPQGRRWSEAIAARVEALDDSAAIERLYALAFGRAPLAEERSLALEFLARQAQRHVAAGHAHPARDARIDLCQALMSANEFIYVD